MKKLLSIVLSVCMLLTLVIVPISVNAEEVTCEDTTLGDYYKFTFGKDGDQFKYAVSTQKTDDTTGQVTHKDNTFYPLWNVSNSVAAWTEYKTITTSDGKDIDVLEIKNTANAYFTPLDKDGKPFELKPGVNYTVKTKIYNPASYCWGQMAVIAGTTNNKEKTNVVGATHKSDGTVSNAAASNPMAGALIWNGGGIVGGSSYAAYLKDGSYPSGSNQIALSSINPQYSETGVSTSRYVNAYVEGNRKVYIEEKYSNGYDVEKNSYSTKFAVEGAEDTYLYGNNYLTLYFDGGNVMGFKGSAEWPLFTNATKEELDELGTIPSCWQIESIEIVSENFKSSLSYSVNGEIVKVVDSDVGTALEPFIPEAPKGKYFAGWFADEACTKLYTAEALEFGKNTVYAKFSDYSTSYVYNFDRHIPTAKYYQFLENGTVKTTFDRVGWTYKKNVDGIETYYSERTWPQSGASLVADENGDLVLFDPTKKYVVTVKYRMSELATEGGYIDLKAGVGMLPSLAGDLEDKAFKVSTNAVQLTKVSEEWTTSSFVVDATKLPVDYLPVIGIYVKTTGAVVGENGTEKPDGTVVDGIYNKLEVDYMEVKAYDGTITYVDGDKEKVVDAFKGDEIVYESAAATRQGDAVWSLSKDEYIAPPTTFEESFKVYAIVDPVISFENYYQADDIKYSLNVGVSEDIALTGNKSLKYENIGYSYTYKKPDKWDTDWTKYYEIVDGEFVKLAGETAPEWVANTYLERRGNSNYEQAIALWQLDGNKSYKVSFKYYVPETLAGDIGIYPYTNGTNIWWTQTDGNGKGRVEYKDSAITIGADAQTGEWLDGEIYFTSTAIPSYDLLYVKVGTTAEEKVIVYFDDFAVQEVFATTFEIPEDAVLEDGGIRNGNIVTVYVAAGEEIVPPLVVGADENPIEVWYDENGEEVTEFVVGGAYSYKSFIYGDCNDDGKIDAVDLAALKLSLAELGKVGLGADCNADGNVDAIDLAALKLYLAELGTLGPKA